MADKRPENAEALVVIRAKRLARDLGVRAATAEVDTSAPDVMTAAQAREYVRRYARKELHNSLSSLVELRDFAQRDSVRRDAAAQLVQFACDDDDTTVGVDTKALGISTEELSEFLRSRRKPAEVR